MKRSLWCLLAFLCCGVEGWASCSNTALSGGWTCVLSNVCNGSSGVCSFSSNGSGHLLIAYFSGNQTGTNPTFTVADTAGNTWTAITSGVGNVTRGGSAFYTCNSASSAGTNTVTFTLATGSAYGYQDLGVLEYSGNATTNCLDNFATDTTGAGTTGNFSATNGDLVSGSSFTASSAGAGFTQRENPDGFFSVEDQVLSGSTANVSFGGTGGTTVTIGAAFKASGGGSTGSTLVGPSAVIGPSKVQ